MRRGDCSIALPPTLILKVHRRSRHARRCAAARQPSTPGRLAADHYAPAAVQAGHAGVSMRRAGGRTPGHATHRNCRQKPHGRGARLPWLEGSVGRALDLAAGGGARDSYREIVLSTLAADFPVSTCRGSMRWDERAGVRGKRSGKDGLPPACIGADVLVVFARIDPGRMPLGRSGAGRSGRPGKSQALMAASVGAAAALRNGLPGLWEKLGRLPASPARRALNLDHAQAGAQMVTAIPRTARGVTRP